MEIIIGPSLELHHGMHGSVLDHPPPDVTYLQPSHRYRYRFRANPFPPNPFDRLAVDEAVAFDTHGVVAAHSCRMPVANPGAWVVDHDDFIVALRYGQFFVVGSERTIRGGHVDEATLQLRQQHILSRYLEPQCRAILFWTEYARRTALRYLSAANLCTGAALETFAAKSDVIYPAVPARPEIPPARGVVRVLYSGRTFDDKGGALALDVLNHLSERFGDAVSLTVVGASSVSVGEREGVNVVPVLARDEYLKLVGNSHIFFSPTLFESFGMALLEAAAAGLAVVTSCGPGMEHVSEMFKDGRHACLVSNDLSYEAKVGAYVSVLERLIADADRRREMGAEARSLVEGGPFSIERRNRALWAHYERLAEPIVALAPAPPSLPRYRLETRDFSEEYCASEIALRRPGGTAVRIHL